MAWNLPSQLVARFASESAGTRAVATNKEDKRLMRTGTVVLLLVAFSCQAGAESVNAEKEIECLALNIYHEARGEPEAGRLAVAFVTLNRVASPLYPNTVCEVVWEKRWSSEYQRFIPQFSWTLDGRPDRPRNPAAWRDALEIARRVYHETPESNVQDALYYHADWVNPEWAANRERILQLGRHTFYR